MKTRVDPKTGMTYVWIPPGSFVMVSQPAHDDEAVREQLRQNNKAATLHNLHTEEGPVPVEDWPELSFRPLAASVTLTRGFWMGQTPVTTEAYESVMGGNPGEFRGAGLPVQGVNWNEAKAYCEAVGMRLPTEAEWEYAARGGVTSIAFREPGSPDPGWQEIDKLAWHYGNSGTITEGKGPAERRLRRTPQLVGQKQPNAFGLHDMLGNVWEWVADCFWDKREPESSLRRIEQLPPELGANVTNPERAPAGTDRVLRGGSHLSRPECISASSRRVVGLDTNTPDIGFRCVGEFEDS